MLSMLMMGGRYMQQPPAPLGALPAAAAPPGAPWSQAAAQQHMSSLQAFLAQYAAAAAPQPAAPGAPPAWAFAAGAIQLPAIPYLKSMSNPGCSTACRPSAQ